MKLIPLLCVLLLLTVTSYCQYTGLDKYIDTFVRKQAFNGVVLVERNNKTVCRKGFGLAERQHQVPVTTDTRFRIASLTKLFTAVLILRLYEQQKLDLHKTIRTYLPAYKGAGGDKVTIHQLLNHTSGIANMDTVTSAASAIANGLPPYQRPYTADELLDKFCSGPLVNTPGKTFDYNNAEYIILGKVIEQLYNCSYEQAVSRNILEPLKMGASGLLYQHDIVTGLADSYFYREDLKQLVHDLPVYSENWYAAGGMYSTANDLLTFSHALFGAKLIGKEALDLLVKPGLDGYGYGLWVDDDIKWNNKSYIAVRRPGLIMGAQGMLFHFLNEDLTVIILCNATMKDASLDDFAYKISKYILTH